MPGPYGSSLLISLAPRLMEHHMWTGPSPSPAAVMWGVVGISLVLASRAPSRVLPPMAVHTSRTSDGESRATDFLVPLGFDQVPSWSWRPHSSSFSPLASSFP